MGALSSPMSQPLTLWCWFQDELEGTLRGHIGLIEEALDRLEGTATEADRGKKMYDISTDQALYYHNGAELTGPGMNIMVNEDGMKKQSSWHHQ